MASTLVSTLYPPLVDTFMPAFIHTRNAKVAFSLSPYNSEGNIKRLHISLIDQKNNQNALQSAGISNQTLGTAFQNTVCLDGILIVPFNMVAKNTNTGIYAVDIPIHFLKKIEGAEESSFKIGQYYKVQLRLDSFAPNVFENEETLSSEYFTKYRQYFSEWSSVCLIRPIEEVDLVLEGFDRAVEDPTYAVSFAQGYMHLVGRMISESERMQSYRFRLKNGEETVSDSGILYPKTATNEINYLFSADKTEPGGKYKLYVDVVTKNQYEFSKEFWIQIAKYGDSSIYPFFPSFDFKENIEDGYVDIRITAKRDGRTDSSLYAPGKMYIKRASSIDNFNTWELLSCTEHGSSGEIDITIRDNTIASMVQYQYSAQFWFTETSVWSSITTSDIIYPTFYDIILSRNNTQLAIRYNGQLTNIKPISQRVKFDTLGSKYPKFAENAYMNYRQYSLSGLICAEGDFNRAFISELEEPYQSNMEKYEEIFGNTYLLRNDTAADDNQIDKNKIVGNSLHDAYPHENWYWERAFRDEVINWLNDGEPKLFRSMPEGNMMVMVTDISLTPNQNIGRLLYNFTATLYEVGDGYSLTELNKAGVIDIINVEDAYASQAPSTDVNDNYYGVKVDSVTTIFQLDLKQGESLRTAFYDAVSSKYVGLLSNYLLDIKSLTFNNIKIQFTSSPQWLTDSLEIATEQTNLFGHAFNGLGTNVFVGENGYYAFPKDTKIEYGTDLILKTGNATVVFIAQYDIYAKAGGTPNYSYVEQTVIGQVSDMYEFDTWIGKSIKSKYALDIINNNNERVTQEIKTFRGLTIEADPYTIVDILYSGEKDPVRIVIGRTGIYSLSADHAISDFKFHGLRMVLNQDASPSELDAWEFRYAEEGENTNHRNTVYADTIYYNGIYYPITKETDDIIIAHVPTDGFITYSGDILQNVYKAGGNW